MVSNKCFVPGCRTGYESDNKLRKAVGGKKLSLFNAPRDEVMLQRWKIAIARKDRELRSKDKVCELHFLPEEVSRYFIHKMPDGATVVIKKEKVNLIKDSIPSIFPYKQSSHSTKDKNKRKSLLRRMSTSKKVMREIIQEEENVVNKILLPFTFNDLLKNLAEVCKPNKFWAVSSHENFIVCVKWDLNYAPERQLIINSDLDVKIMFYGNEVSITSSTVINSIESLSFLIMEVDKYIVCAGALNGNKNCLLCLERSWGAPGRPKSWCIGCKGGILTALKRKESTFCLKT